MTQQNWHSRHFRLQTGRLASQSFHYGCTSILKTGYKLIAYLSCSLDIHLCVIVRGAATSFQQSMAQAFVAIKTGQLSFAPR